MKITTDNVARYTADFAIDALAVKRLTRLLTEDVILEPFRNWLWKKHPPEDNGIGYMITCTHCSSMWIAAGVQVARMISPTAWNVAARALALSGVTSLIAENS